MAMPCRGSLLSKLGASNLMLRSDIHVEFVKYALWQERRTVTSRVRNGGQRKGGGPGREALWGLIGRSLKQALGPGGG